MTTPISVSELLERGMDDRLMQIVHGLIGDQLRPPAGVTITKEEQRALGYYPPCPCGEAGMTGSACGCGESCAACCDPGDCDCRTNRP